jgi:hypothetical protein
LDVASPAAAATAPSEVASPGASLAVGVGDSAEKHSIEAREMMEYRKKVAIVQAVNKGRQCINLPPVPVPVSGDVAGRNCDGNFGGDDGSDDDSSDVDSSDEETLKGKAAATFEGRNGDDDDDSDDGSGHDELLKRRAAGMLKRNDDEEGKARAKKPHLRQG